MPKLTSEQLEQIHNLSYFFAENASAKAKSLNKEYSDSLAEEGLMFAVSIVHGVPYDDLEDRPSFTGPDVSVHQSKMDNKVIALLQLLRELNFTVTEIGEDEIRKIINEARTASGKDPVEDYSDVSLNAYKIELVPKPQYHALDSENNKVV